MIAARPESELPKKVMQSMNSTRKTLYLLKFVEIWTDAQTVWEERKGDDLVRVLKTAKMVSMGTWMLFENQQWAHGIGAITCDTKQSAIRGLLY
jgi:hypothetical protein